MQQPDARHDAVPALKWVGGKRSLLTHLRSVLPERWNTYWEPFLGGGALFFDLAPEAAELSDINSELITTYQCLRDNVEDVIARLEDHASSHQHDLLRSPESTPARERFEHYYRVREQSPHALPDVAQAARMLYLNRTCFNGLYRVNQAGRFNVPAGSYRAPDIVRAELLRACSRALSGARLAARDFAAITPKEGDLVYLDPPYDSEKAGGFTAYAAAGFDAHDQRRVRDLALHAVSQGATVVVSNHDTRLVRALYNDSRFVAHTVQAPRRVGARSSSRRPATELVVVATPAVGLPGLRRAA